MLLIEYHHDSECMYCIYCKRVMKRNNQQPRCQNSRITDVQKHKRQSSNHCVATESYIMGLSGATVTTGFHRLTTECEEAIIAAMKNIYWLANKRRQALLKYNSLNSLKKKKRLQNCLLVEDLDVMLRISIEGLPIEQFDFSRALNVHVYKSTRQHRSFQKETFVLATVTCYCSFFPMKLHLTHNCF